MNRAELLSQIISRTDVPARDADQVLSAFQTIVMEAVATGDEKVLLPGFLAFERVDRPARDARNPATGEPLHIPAGTAVKVTAGRALKAAGRAS